MADVGGVHQMFPATLWKQQNSHSEDSTLLKTYLVYKTNREKIQPTAKRASQNKEEKLDELFYNLWLKHLRHVLYLLLEFFHVHIKMTR